MEALSSSALGEREILLKISTGTLGLMKIRAKIKWAYLSGLKNTFVIEFTEVKDIEKILHVV